MRRMLLVMVLLACSLDLAEAGTITRPSKSFGGTSFITGVVPTAADFNGDIDTAYSEINGSIANVNISASAAIAGSKISPAFTTGDASITTANPCLFWTESDQAADAQRWYACVSDGVWQLHTRTDAGVVQATPIRINRSTGVITFVDAMIATQAQMETATSTVTIVTPGRTHFHPGVAKGWANFNCISGLTIDASYNVTGITWASTGNCTITWDVDFSSANYPWAGSTDGFVALISAAAGTLNIGTYNTTPTLADRGDVSIVAFGDQ